MESLLRIDSGDFEIIKTNEDEETYYNLYIEGYIGFESIQEFIDLYKTYLKQMFSFLIDNGYHREKNSNNWNRIYRKREIEVSYFLDNFWVFLSPYKSTDIWDLYDYLQEVIEQLEEDKEKIEKEKYKLIEKKSEKIENWN